MALKLVVLLGFSVLCFLNYGAFAETDCLNVQKEIEALKDLVKSQGMEIKQMKTQMEIYKGLHEKDSSQHDLSNIKRFLVNEEVGADGRVAFYAHLSKNLDNLGNHQPIVFDTVRTNQGSAYHKEDGEFNASIAGTYFFIWTISNGDGTYMQSEIVVNGVVWGQIISDSGNHNDWAVSTSFAIVPLKVGDRVWIRSGTVHSGHVNGIGLGTSSFAGFIMW